MTASSEEPVDRAYEWPEEGFLARFVRWLSELLGLGDASAADDAADDDVLDAWLDEDEIGASGL